MTKFSMQQALMPLCLSAFVLGVRGYGGLKSNLELTYGLIFILFLVLTAIYSGYRYYHTSILQWGDRISNQSHFMIFVELLGFILNVFLLLPISIYIIIGQKYVIKAINILKLHLKILHCEKKIYKKLKKFSLYYSLSAWLCFSFFISLNYVLWIDFTDFNYFVFAFTFDMILLQQSMVEGQMLAIMLTQKWMFHSINLDIKVSADIFSYFWYIIDEVLNWQSDFNQIFSNSFRVF
jgi:hypothetical protein